MSAAHSNSLRPAAAPLVKLKAAWLGVGAAIAALGLALAFAGPVAAQPMSAAGGRAGVIPHRAHSGKVEGSFPIPEPSLQYLGGPVLQTNEPFVIFWDPAGELSTSYRALITRFFKDVAAESGQTSNVYSVLNQYSDSNGPIKYESTFAGSATDQDPFPSGCPAQANYPACFNDQQLASELDSFLNAQGITRSSNRLFMVLTPPGVNVCFDAGGRFCRSNSFCAYHSDFVSGENHVPYAIAPYPTSACDEPRFHPNASFADPAISMLAHEHMEMINDPLAGEAEELGPPLAWYDPEFGEGSDKCEGYAGPLRKNGSGFYNQVINGHKYIVPTQWSNAAAQAQGFGCVLNGQDHPPVADFSATVHGTRATLDGHLSTDPDPGDSISAYHWHFGDGSTLWGPPAKVVHHYAAPGTYTVQLLVADQAGAVTSVERQVTVGR